MTVPASSASPAAAVRERATSTCRSILRTAVLRQVESLLQILEAEIPANPEDPRNQKLTRSLQRDMVAYFDALEDAIPVEAIERLYYSLVAQE